jgi:hypothetical protein
MVVRPGGLRVQAGDQLMVAAVPGLLVRLLIG